MSSSKRVIIDKPQPGNQYVVGQSYAMPAIAWGERSENVSPPGVPLEEMVAIPGTPIVKEGFVVPSDAPGFGMCGNVVVIGGSNIDIAGKPGVISQLGDTRTDGAVQGHEQDVE